MDVAEFGGARRDLATWSQPIVYDLLHELYARHFGPENPSVRVLALSHGRLWRLVLLGEHDKLDVGWREFMAIARLTRVPLETVNGINQGVLQELMDIVVTRCLSSPSRARYCGHILLDAATILARQSVVAA